MKKTKKLLALLLVCMMVASITACGKSDSNDTSSPPAADSPSASTSGNTGDSGNTSSPADPGSSSSGAAADPGASSAAAADSGRTLNVAIGQDSGSLHPFGATGGFFGIMYAFYEPLMDTYADGSTRWILATGLDRISDIQATLHIRENVTFSNGNLMTAEDVLFSMELCVENPQFALNVKAIDFEKTKVIDDYTIDLWYTQYNASQEPGMSQLFIVNKESYDEVALTRDPIGTGPYVVKEYIVNSHVTLEGRDDYWAGPPAIKNVEYKVINEPAQIINALETGEIDMAGIDITDVSYVESLGYDVMTYMGGYNYVTMFSMDPNGPLATKEARWAVSHAIDRQAIADILFSGLSTITDAPVSHSLIDMEPRFFNLNETYSIGYNLEKAQELAEQSGLIGKAVRIITNGSAGYNTVAEIIQNDLLSIGVDAQIVNYDQATYFPTMADASQFEIAIFTPGAPSMMASDILAMYFTFIPLGWAGPERDRYGELSMGALTTADEAQASELLFQTFEMFVDIDPWYGLCEVLAARATAPELGMRNQMATGISYLSDMFWK